MKLKEKGFSGSEKKAYSIPCDTLHFDARYTAGFGHLAKNSIITSSFNFFEAELNPKVLGLKYVAGGEENYILKGKRYLIPAGKYLLVNESSARLEVAIKNTVTRSLCVNIEQRLLNEILLQMQRPDDLENYQLVSQHLLTPEIFVRAATASKEFQQALGKVFESVEQGLPHTLPVEHIFDLTSLLVQENLDVIRSYYKLKTARPSTRQELFHRLYQGKEMLDDSIFSDLSIAEVASDCCLSEFRFYRLFKQCFGVSPYNYLIKRRMEKSLDLKKLNLSWGEIAYQLNFTDQAAFSNAFKKVMGVSPSVYKAGS
jgi:AraC family transcriptional regulator